MRISDWSSDVCSSDLDHLFRQGRTRAGQSARLAATLLFPHQSVLTEHRMTRPSLLARLSQAFLCLLLPSLAFASPAAAERIKDLGTFQSVRANQLTGSGIVVGLAGKCAASLDYATPCLKGMVSRLAREIHRLNYS